MKLLSAVFMSVLGCLAVVSGAYADSTTHAVQVTCYPYSRYVEARLIQYFGCGDGHCVEEGFEETPEGKSLKEAGITLILPGKEKNEYTCDLGKSVITVEVVPSFGSNCAEEGLVTIHHNGKLVADNKLLWRDCWSSKAYREISYKAFYNNPTSTLGGLFYEGIDKEGKLFYPK